MSITEPSFTLGIEEEYLLVDRETRGLVIDPPETLMAEAEAKCGSRSRPSCSEVADRGRHEGQRQHPGGARRPGAPAKQRYSKSRPTMASRPSRRLRTRSRRGCRKSTPRKTATTS